MRLGYSFSILIGLVFIAGTVPASAKCLSGFKSSLLAGGFTGSTDCKHDRLSIKHVGLIRASGQAFDVYSYEYQLRPACNGCAIHGGQRILFMNDGRYLGQYAADEARAEIRRGELVIVPDKSAHGATVRVQFTRDGPPKKVLIAGDRVELFK